MVCLSAGLRKNAAANNRAESRVELCLYTSMPPLTRAVTTDVPLACEQLPLQVLPAASVGQAHTVAASVNRSDTQYGIGMPLPYSQRDKSSQYAGPTSISASLSVTLPRCNTAPCVARYSIHVATSISRKRLPASYRAKQYPSNSTLATG